MHRLTVLCCVLLVAVLNASCAQATEPSATTRGPVWAYGTEVQGEAWFEERAGISYYQGTHQYWPRRHLVPAQPMEMDPNVAACSEVAFGILDEASAAAQDATTATDWMAHYTQVLDTHRDAVVSYTPMDGCVVIEFYGVPIKSVISCPVGAPKSADRIASDPDSVRQAQVNRFWKFYNNGSWIFWGIDYFTVVPPVWEAKTIAAIDQVNTLKARGLSGDALTRAIATIDIKNTALEEANFLRDLIASEGR